MSLRSTDGAGSPSPSGTEPGSCPRRSRASASCRRQSPRSPVRSRHCVRHCVRARRARAPAPELGWHESAERAERAPISLTASDGSGLTLVALHARTVIEDPLAFTELHLTFHNPEPRRREGRFEITLPQQAAISRFAMRVGDRLQEGEVVERRRAQQVYEEQPRPVTRAAGTGRVPRTAR